MSRKQRKKYIDRPDKREQESSNRRVQQAEQIIEPKFAKPIVRLVAKTNAQQKYINIINNNILTVCSGAAGSGKTYIAASIALQYLMADKVDKIILTRPAVEAGEKLGALPGTLEDKYSPYLEPLEDIFVSHIGKGFYKYLLSSGKIVGKPMAYLRGVTFNNSFVLCEESQNTTISQMMLFLTRIGENSKVIVSGDVNQSDIRQTSGLKDALEVLSNVPDVGFHTFTIDDCVRSTLTKNILKQYENRS
jgi:phosphate starvation-inducible PhoH-like protein